ncbi:MAG: primosomal protein N' [Patescibacteria group bacterium]
MKPSGLYRLEIAPLVILPLGRSPFFSYLSSEPVASGSYMSIPFGKRSIEGVVFGCAPLPGRAPTWMKFAGASIENAFLTKEQRELAEHISRKYFTPLGKTLRHFLPKRAKARQRKEKSFAETLEKPRATKEETGALKKFAALKDGVPGYVDTSSVEDPRRLFAHLAKNIASKKQQALFLVPETTLLPEWEAALLRYFPREKIIALSSQLADGPYFEAWERIRSGTASIILSTRQGLFAPFRNLGLVTLLEEQDESYKQWDMSPRYDGKRVAEHLAAIHGANFLLASGTPGIESRYHLGKKQYVPLSPITETPPLAGAFEIVNLRLERFRKNYSPLSRALAGAIREALSGQKQVLLYIHRQGMNAFSVCEHCKNIFRCPQSGHALTGDKDGTFRCLACSYRSGSFPSCPSCGHLSFRHVGFGTDRVEREVMGMFPGARTFRADGSTMRAPESARKLYEKISENDIDILIGTQMILKGPVLPKLALIGMIDADSLLSFPDFRADEKLFQILERAVKQTGALEKSRKGKVIIQTFHPESTFFQRITALDSEAFSNQILTEREELAYPPFSRLISIICQGHTKKETDVSAQTLEVSLRGLLPKGDSRYRLSAPQSAKRKFSRKAFESTLLLRIPDDRPIAENIDAFLRKNNTAYIIDVDPLSFS